MDKKPAGTQRSNDTVSPAGMGRHLGMGMTLAGCSPLHLLPVLCTPQGRPLTEGFVGLACSLCGPRGALALLVLP